MRSMDRRRNSSLSSSSSCSYPLPIPVPVPKGVTYTLKDNHLSVKVCGTSDDEAKVEEEDESRE